MSNSSKKRPTVLCVRRTYAQSHPAQPWCFAFRVLSKGRGEFSIYRNAPDAFVAGQRYYLAMTPHYPSNERKLAQGQDPRDHVAPRDPRDHVAQPDPRDHVDLVAVSTEEDQ